MATHAVHPLEMQSFFLCSKASLEPLQEKIRKKENMPRLGTGGGGRAAEI
jgi:hypothetical protein